MALPRPPKQLPPPCSSAGKPARQPDYSPAPGKSLAAQAEQKHISLGEMAYALLLEDDGEAVLYCPVANFVDGNLDAVHQMLTSPHTIIGLGDGGAHYGVICDSSLTTYC